MSEKVSRLTKSFFNCVNECFAHSTSTQIHLWSPPQWTRCPADVVNAEVECPSQNVSQLSHRWGDVIKRKLCSHAENSGKREQPATSSGHAESSLFRLDYGIIFIEDGFLIVYPKPRCVLHWSRLRWNLMIEDIFSITKTQRDNSV